MKAKRGMSGQDKARAYRARLRAKGLRPVQHWVPDTNSPQFLERARRQCATLRGDPEEAAILDEIEALAADLLKDLPR